MTTRGSLALRALFAVATSICALLIQAQAGTAGTYDVYACRIPYGAKAGEPAPVEVAESGVNKPGKWKSSVTGSALYGNRCSSGGALEAALEGGIAHSNADLATWTFSAPTGESITGATLWRAGDADGGSGYLFWMAAETDPSATEAVTSEHTFDGCAFTWGCPHPEGLGNTNEALAGANAVKVSAEHFPSEYLFINASCERGSCPSTEHDAQGYASVVYLYAADISLEEQATPTISEVGGELPSAASLKGTASLYFHATDPGSGVYRTLVTVDGKLLQSAVIDETGLCKEVSVPAEGQPAFLSAIPCPNSANGRVSLDTTQLSNGSHHLLVEVTNAAGNATTVIDRAIEVANGATSGGTTSGGVLSGGAIGTLISGISGPTGDLPNGVEPSADAMLTAQWASARDAKVEGGRRQRLTGRFGDAETIAGRLTGPHGVAIADATIQLQARDSYGGAPTVALQPAHTDRQGNFTIRLSRQSPSEQIQLSYSPTLGGSPVTSQTLRLRVRAAVTLHVKPGSVTAGQTIRLQGRVLGEPIPPGGKQVVLEARSKGSPWLQFLVLRSGKSGRFVGSHRFRLPGPVRYRFRAICPEEADFPFATGSSRAVSVWER